MNYISIMRQAIDAIKAGDTELGKDLLITVLEQDENDEGAWLWMTRCVDDLETKRECFERVLSVNPSNVHALRGLARMEGEPAKSAQKTQGLGLLDVGLLAMTLFVVLVGVWWTTKDDEQPSSQPAETVTVTVASKTKARPVFMYFRRDS